MEEQDGFRSDGKREKEKEDDRDDGIRDLRAHNPHAHDALDQPRLFLVQAGDVKDHERQEENRDEREEVFPEVT